MNESNKIFPLWEGRSVPFVDPADTGRTEHFLTKPVDGIDRLADVTEPSVTWYPVSGKAPHPAVLVCPGGAYQILAWNHEGQDICAFLNTIGFTAFLLKYRCPHQRAAAHADAVRAMRFIRANADRFAVRADRVGAMGFSAGAHLTACLAASAESEAYPAEDAVDRESGRPNFTALIYPAYLSDVQLNLAPEFRVDASTPPAFLLQAEDDGCNVESSMAWFLALKRAGVQAEMHLYPNGGHGYGLLRTGDPIADWPALASGWFRRQGGLL